MMENRRIITMKAESKDPLQTAYKVFFISAGLIALMYLSLLISIMILV
jgi:hypothetical protein